MRKRRRFTRLNDIADLYGTSRHLVAYSLRMLGLYTRDGQPSQLAIDEEYVVLRRSRYFDADIYVWDYHKITEALDNDGYDRAEQ